MSHGVLPSQIRTLDSGLASARAMTSGGGANGQAACLGIGYSGMSEVTSVVELVSVSDIVPGSPHSSIWMASAGHAAAARRAPSACSAGGCAVSRTTTPSSSRWSKTSGAFITQLPDDAQICWSTVTFITDSSLVRRDGRQPQAHDRVNEAGGGSPPGRTRQRCARCERAFEIRAGVYQQIAGHDVSFVADISRQVGKAT